jgi:hypothetical protein
MRFGRITRYALLLVPLFVCVGRLHAQRAASPSTLLQEANRCLSLVRAGSRRRQQNEREQRMEPERDQHTEPMWGSGRPDTIAISRQDHQEQQQAARSS